MEIFLHKSSGTFLEALVIENKIEISNNEKE
jgi:hypothetical protein